MIKVGSDMKAKSKIGQTALMNAAATGHLEVVKIWINEGANVNWKYNSGETALMLTS